MNRQIRKLVFLFPSSVEIIETDSNQTIIRYDKSPAIVTVKPVENVSKNQEPEKTDTASVVKAVI